MFNALRRSFSGKILFSVLGLGIILWIVVSELGFPDDLILNNLSSTVLLVFSVIFVAAIAVSLVILLRNLVKNLSG